MLPTPSTRSLLYTHTLKNGLQLVGQPMPDYGSVALSYYAHTGSRDEASPEVAGLSHFLEHMVLKGTQTLNGEQLSREFQRIGAEINAYTSYESTTYHARVISEHLAQALALLSSMMHPRLDEQDFTREKEVIVNEIARAEDQPYNLVYRRMMQAYFGDHPLGHDVLGTRESIREMRREQMYEYWERRYAANNLIFAIAGSFDWSEVVDLAEQHCATWRVGESGRVISPYEPRPASNHVVVNPKQNQQIMLLAMPAPDVYDQRYYAVQLACNVLGAEGFRLYWNIRQQGLAESASTSTWTFEGIGMLLVEANSTVQEAPRVLKLLYAELDNWLAHGIEEDELRRAKDKWISTLVLGSESTFARMRSLATDWAIEGRLLSLDEEIERIERVTRGDIRQALESFPMREKCLLTALGPLNENELLADCRAGSKETFERR